jgi:hypothetical protein
MRFTQPTMRPLDIVVLLKIVAYGETPWLQQPMAVELIISQSELSKSMARSKYAGLLDEPGKNVRCLALMEFLEHGVAYAFPQQPGSMVRGIPTSQSASPLRDQIKSDESYVWPSAKGKIKGQAITPLYKSVPNAVLSDAKLYEMLALVDAIRVGSMREKKLAVSELKTRLLA